MDINRGTPFNFMVREEEKSYFNICKDIIFTAYYMYDLNKWGIYWNDGLLKDLLSTEEIQKNIQKGLWIPTQLPLNLH